MVPGWIRAPYSWVAQNSQRTYDQKSSCWPQGLCNVWTVPIANMWKCCIQNQTIDLSRSELFTQTGSGFLQPLTEEFHIIYYLVLLKLVVPGPTACKGVAVASRSSSPWVPQLHFRLENSDAGAQVLSPQTPQSWSKSRMYLRIHLHA